MSSIILRTNAAVLASLLVFYSFLGLKLFAATPSANFLSEDKEDFDFDREQKCLQQAFTQPLFSS